MNFNYSYRAFLITCLLVGNLVLLLLTVNLSGNQEEEESQTAVEYTPDLYNEELETVIEEVQIETNTAYNEAEEFITELENIRNETEAISEETSENNPANDSSLPNELAINDAREKLSEVREKLAANAQLDTKLATESTANKKTTISYRLVDRKAISLRNPVYTCDRGGKVVITIEVNASGTVVQARYNKNASTTTNGCLIESALNYANQSKFTTSSEKEKQIGTITYLFPGQY